MYIKAGNENWPVFLLSKGKVTSFEQKARDGGKLLQACLKKCQNQERLTSIDMTLCFLPATHPPTAPP